MDLFELCAKFGIDATFVKAIDTGIINKTFLVEDKDHKKFILQEINNYVFSNVDELMNNIERVSNFINNKSYESDDSIQTLSIVKSEPVEYNYIHVFDEDYREHYFRMYNFIDNAVTFDQADTEHLYEAGVGFGNFQKQLDGFDAETLFETIPNFHNTPLRFEMFKHAQEKALSENPERLKKAEKEIEFANQNASISGIIVDALSSGEIPVRVVHNDTKLNNVMFDKDTGKAVAIIDLDTVMPGSLLYDYGDAIRFISNTAPEDERDLDKIGFDFEKFDAFTSGYLKETFGILTPKELELMPQAPLVLTYELGIRFLADYLEGDKYFVCDPSRPDHNLERAKAQFRLLEIMKTLDLNSSKQLNF